MFLIAGILMTHLFSFAMISDVYLVAVPLEQPVLHYILVSLPAVFVVFFLISWRETLVYTLLVNEE